MFDEPISSQDSLISHLAESTQVLGDERLKAAFEVVDRQDFVPADYRLEAYEDYPLPIQAGQTISQPTTVAFMLEKLAVEEGQKVLDLGAGSGWTTALLAHLVGEQGRVIGVEREPELVEFGRENLARYDLPQARIEPAGKKLGWPAEAPFDRILASAAAEELPEELLTQLQTPGRMVLPIQDTITVLQKHKDGSWEKDLFPGFVFVPLRKAEG